MLGQVQDIYRSKHSLNITFPCRSRVTHSVILPQDRVPSGLKASIIAEYPPVDGSVCSERQKISKGSQPYMAWIQARVSLLSHRQLVTLQCDPTPTQTNSNYLSPTPPFFHHIMQDFPEDITNFHLCCRAAAFLRDNSHLQWVKHLDSSVKNVLDSQEYSCRQC